MTILFLLALALLGFVMKLATMLPPHKASETHWPFLLSPVLSPNSLRRAQLVNSARRAALKAALLIAVLALSYWAYWTVVRVLNIHGLLLSYLATPIVLLMGEAVLSVLTLLWLPSGRLLPRLHNRPFCAHS